MKKAVHNNIRCWETQGQQMNSIIVLKKSASLLAAIFDFTIEIFYFSSQITLDGHLF